MLLCEYCQSELKSRGVRIWIGEMEYSLEESMDQDVPCEWCDEYDDLYDVTLS